MPAQREVKPAGAAIARRGAQIERYISIEPQTHRALACSDGYAARADGVRQFIQIAGDVLRRAAGARLNVWTWTMPLALVLMASVVMVMPVMVFGAAIMAVITRSGVCVMGHTLLLFCAFHVRVSLMAARCNSQ